jgi:four helix bundle protein
VSFHFPAVLARLKDATRRLRRLLGRCAPSQSLTRAPRGGAAWGDTRAVRDANHGETAMLRIHDDMLDVLRMMRGVLGAIERRDADLGRQLRRAASSVVLNVAEGSGSFGRMRLARYRTALGSARETLACLRVAEAFGYVEAMPDGLLVRMNRVVGTLVRVAA